MSNETSAVMNENCFSLDKVKFPKDGGIELKYSITENVNGNSFLNHFKVTFTENIHKDLADLFGLLVPVVAEVFTIVNIEKLEVDGVTLSGLDKNFGVVINAQYLASNGLLAKINTPRIKLANTTFGFEEALHAIVKNIEHEVYQYLFYNKRAKLSVFGEDMTDNAEQETTDE